MPQPFTFLADEHAYIKADGTRVLSVTQILEGAGLVDYEGIPEDVLKHKADIGTAVHAAAHFYDENDLLVETLDPEVAPYVRAWIKFREEMNFLPKLIEHRGIAKIDMMEYGYTLDRVGLLRGGALALIEIKCTAAVEMSWGPQTAAYEMAIRSQTRKALPRMAVHLKPTGNYSLVPLSDTHDYNVFKAALLLETWKLSKRRNGHGN